MKVLYLTIRPVARKGYGSIAHEAKPNGLLIRSMIRSMIRSIDPFYDPFYWSVLLIRSIDPFYVIYSSSVNEGALFND